MTENEWLACSDPDPMLEYLRGKASERQLRLFAVACCRRIWALIRHQGYRGIVEVAERVADSQVPATALRAAEQAAYDQHGGQGIDPALWAATHCGSSPELLESWPFCDGDDVPYTQAARAAANVSDNADHTVRSERLAQSRLLHDLFGPRLFKPVRLDPVWLLWNAGTVLRIAEAIYREKAFDRLPILADALEEAGCHAQDILAHCRSAGEHVRGCWVIDLLLGKE